MLDRKAVPVVHILILWGHRYRPLEGEISSDLLVSVKNRTENKIEIQEYEIHPCSFCYKTFFGGKLENLDFSLSQSSKNWPL